MKRNEVRQGGTCAAEMFRRHLACAQGLARRLHAGWSGVLLAAMAAGALSAVPSKGEDATTVAGLRITYERECNTRLEYDAFAARAERDGMPLAALAFRVAAVGESVHAAQQALQLARLGVDATWKAKRVAVRSTAENLCQSIANEVYENQYIYRQIVDQLRTEGISDVIMALDRARAAEATHVALFARALQEIDPIDTGSAYSARRTSPRSKAETVFYVCMSDGSVFTSLICGACPNCGGMADLFRRMTLEQPELRAALPDERVHLPR